MHLIRGGLVSALALALLACGGGGGSGGAASATPDADVQLSGVVIDGYLSGARACLDMNDNFACDSTEPATMSDATGHYTLTVKNSQSQSYRVIVEVLSTTIDADTGSAVAKPYVLMAPIGKHAVVSPLTTLVAQQMISKGINLATAQQMITGQIRVSANILGDYGVSNADASQQATHNAARIIGKALADNWEATTTSLGSLSGPAKKTALLYVMQHVFNQLPAIADQAPASIAGFDPATATVSPIEVVNLAAALQAMTLSTVPADAQTSAIQGLYQVSLYGSFFNWVVSLTQEGDSLVERNFAFQDGMHEYAPAARHVIGSTGWVDIGANRTATYSGNRINIQDASTLPLRTMLLDEIDIGGQSVRAIMSVYLDPVQAAAIDFPASDSFPAGAKLYLTRWQSTADQYALYGQDPAFQVGFTALSAAMTHYASSGSNWFGLNENNFKRPDGGQDIHGIQAQFAASATMAGSLILRHCVTPYAANGDAGTETCENLPHEGAWARQTLNGVELLTFSLPSEYTPYAANYGRGLKSIWAVKDGEVWEGYWSPARESSGYLLNKIAFDHIQGYL